MSTTVKRYTADELKAILDAHKKWLRGEEGGAGANLSRADLSGACLSGANLSRADLSGACLSGANLSWANLSWACLSGANLSGAYLSGAYLSGAYLSGANLSGAYLSGAYLSGANLSRANLSEAYLSGANLSRADLSEAYLSGANLSGAYLSGAVTWEQYIGEVVPALLTAGGKTIAEVLATGCWDCHSWENCPTHAAFGANSLSEVPALYRAEASRFIDFFDATALPLDKMPWAKEFVPAVTA